MADKAENDYEVLIERVSRYAQALSDDNDRKLVQLWVNRLSQENKNSPSRHNRNVYAQYLAHQLRHQSLNFPFNEPPPQDELEPLAELVYAKRFKTKPRGKYWRTVSETAYQTTTIDRLPSKKKEVVCDDSLRMKLAELGPDVTLTEFVAKISPFTVDMGATLQKVMQEEMDWFRTTAEHLLESRNAELSDVLIRQHGIQMEYKNSRQEKLRSELQACHNQLFDMVPDWSWEKYRSDPNYIKEIAKPKICEDEKYVERQAREQRRLWKEEALQKIATLNQVMKGLKKGSEELSDMLYEVQHKSCDRQTKDALTIQLQYEHNFGIYNRLKFLRAEKADLEKKKEELDKKRELQKLEKSKTSS